MDFVRWLQLTMWMFGAVGGLWYSIRHLRSVMKVGRHLDDTDTNGGLRLLAHREAVEQVVFVIIESAMILTGILSFFQGIRLGVWLLAILPGLVWFLSRHSYRTRIALEPHTK